MTPEAFEAATGLAPLECAALLCVSPGKWYDWRRGDRKVPPYIAASMRAHLLLHERGVTLRQLLPAAQQTQPAAAKRTRTGKEARRRSA